MAKPSRRSRADAEAERRRRAAERPRRLSGGDAAQELVIVRRAREVAAARAEAEAPATAVPVVTDPVQVALTLAVAASRSAGKFEEMRAERLRDRDQHVAVLREAGWSWVRIAAALGVSRQALMKRS